MSQKPSASSNKRHVLSSTTGGGSPSTSTRPAGSSSRKDAAGTPSASGGKGKAKAKAKMEDVAEEDDDDAAGGGGAGTDAESEAEDEEEEILLTEIRQKSDAFHAKRAKKASQQHDEFKKTINETLSGVRRDIQQGWESDEEAIDKAMARLEPFLAPEPLNKAEYARAHSARGVIWNSLGHLYQEGVDEAISAIQDEDAAHLHEIESRPAEIKRARKKAIQLAQKEVAEVHDEVSVITNGHDLIRAWSAVLKPHPTRFASTARSPAGKKKRLGMYGAGVGGMGAGGSLRKIQAKKLKGMGAGGGGLGAGVGGVGVGGGGGGGGF